MKKNSFFYDDKVVYKPWGHEHIIYKDKKQIFYFSNAAYLLLFFTPLLPGGGIFSTLNGSLFWIIFSLTNLRYSDKN